tara:strand:+ start:34 stop:849 length:816 start_codon:yes stop_codon:yes gene_type:complete
MTKKSDPKGKKKKKNQKKITKSKKNTKSKYSNKIKNRYNSVRSALSKYCYETYGRRCTNEEMNSTYRQLKEKRPAADFSLSDILDQFENILRNRDKESLPSSFKTFDWFNAENLLFRMDGFFFKPEDNISFDMRSLSLPVVDTLYGDLPEAWSDEIYSELRNRSYEAEEMGFGASPVPFFKFSPELSDVDNRDFVFVLDHSYSIPSGYRWDDGAPSVPQTRVIEQAGQESSQIDNLNRMLDQAVKDVEAGRITKEQYAERTDAIYKRLNNL